MSEQLDIPPDLLILFAAVCDEVATQRQLEELEDAMRDDERMRRLFLGYCRLHIDLYFAVHNRRSYSAVREHIGQESPAIRVYTASDDSSPCPPVASFFLSDMTFAYVIATILCGVGLWLGSIFHVSFFGSKPIASNATSPSPATRPSVVRSGALIIGQVTGLSDCRLTDSGVKVFVGDTVLTDQTYSLDSGLLEITYDTGAKVILQGPCKYVIDSTASGFLQIGKLTARVEKDSSEVKGERTANQTLSCNEKEATTSLALRPRRVERRELRVESRENISGQWPVASGQITANPKSDIQSPKSPSPLFVVRTPTATVTDLGTEFGVEVKSSGTCIAHVFQGKVRVRSVVGNRSYPYAASGKVTESESGGQVLQLSIGESAIIERGVGHAVRIVRATPDDVRPNAFVHHIYERVSIPVFNTGVGMKKGDRDPHWQLVARSDDRNFKPRQALVIGADPKWRLPNNPPLSQWISLLDESSPVPDQVIYTFRTTFDLVDANPDTAVLRGRFIVDNYVDAIRLNGQSLELKPHGNLPPFITFSEFTATYGFVAGTNVLEIDVVNGMFRTAENLGSRSRSYMACRVELEGTVMARTNASRHSTNIKGKETLKLHFPKKRL